eukprot:CAMPEP_0114373462 /NCGR_PEP_ID=MMETSP0101-20121206/34884_1 /TAXON_ID=38822 ORGANISM="Pteridomonas danica, Strain PT" /NCGR_SAMPLE_ID=MMETSP0101 /ASSEMBLY_ACC=CAM_ASM_000211 /LENGTH=839 /DNA_ID=CAMNT_0001526715 /DNA_START=811 /DNA_END=3326 /DNA_ORIENTATION=+
MNDIDDHNDKYDIMTQYSDNHSPERTTKTNHCLQVQEISSFVEYYKYMSDIRAKKSPSTLLLYHYTNPKIADLILESGLRMSTQGQGDGGVYFSLLGPASYGFGVDINNKNEEGEEEGGEDYETRLIVDCYGKERLKEYHGKGTLSLVLVCAVEEGLLSPAPGGRDNALMVPKQMFETLCLPSEGSYFLPPCCIQGAFHLHEKKPQQFENVCREGSTRGEGLSDLMRIEIDNDNATRDKAQIAMKKLKKLSGNNVLALLPSTLPELPSAFMPRSDILDQLKSCLSITNDNSEEEETMSHQLNSNRCVLQGMGGMGKSTLVASFAYDTEVRAAFDKIVWISLGQNPDIQALQESVHLQLTGEPLPASISALPQSIIPQQRRAALRSAAAGTDVLLILDDVWDASHEKEFALLDPDSRSALLVSTRIRGLFKGNAVEVAIKHLDTDSALSLLLAKSGINETSFIEKSEKTENTESSDDIGIRTVSNIRQVDNELSQYDLALEIVSLTGSLSLTLSIAGGLIEANGGEITKDLVEMMKEDKLRSTTIQLSFNNGIEGQSPQHKRTLEDRLITASLSMFQDENEHLAQSCFLSFAAFPEDCIVPALLFDSLAPFFVSDSDQRSSVFTPTASQNRRRRSSIAMINKKKSIISVRKIMTALVSVNLISGSFADAGNFSVHDIIRDYTTAFVTPEYLQRLHFEIITLLLEKLPNESHFDYKHINTNNSNSNSSVDAATITYLHHITLYEYAERYLKWHMESFLNHYQSQNEHGAQQKGFDDDNDNKKGIKEGVNNEGEEEMYIIPDSWLSHRNVIVRQSLARALGIKGIEKYSQYFISQKEKINAA